MNVQLVKVNSHTITFDHYGDVKREECYPYLDAEVRGEIRSIRCECDRYLGSSGLTEWRTILREVKPGEGIGPQTRSAIREAVLPLVEAWLESEAYDVSRQSAFAWAFKNEIRNINTTADYRYECAIKKHGPELSGEDHERIVRAAALRMESLRLLEGQPAGSWTAVSP